MKQQDSQVQHLYKCIVQHLQAKLILCVYIKLKYPSTECYTDNQQVKEYIIRAKAWRNRLWPKSQRGSGRPSSYLISLLVLKAYENQQARHSRYQPSSRDVAQR